MGEQLRRVDGLARLRHREADELLVAAGLLDDDGGVRDGRVGRGWGIGMVGGGAVGVTASQLIITARQFTPRARNNSKLPKQDRKFKGNAIVMNGVCGCVLMFCTIGQVPVKMAAEISPISTRRQHHGPAMNPKPSSPGKNRLPSQLRQLLPFPKCINASFERKNTIIWCR